MTDEEKKLITATGREVTPEELEKLADEAEKGYDVSELVPRAAGERKTDRLSAGLDTSETIAAVKVARELDTTYRTYRKEWQFDRRFDTLPQAEIHVEAKWASRLEPADIMYRPSGEQFETWVRRWNVAGEWKTEFQAQSHADRMRLGGTPAELLQVVTRNSRAEVQLRNYGILKLVAKT